jgi:hypothetical protein
MWFLIVAVLTGAGSSQTPYRTDVFMERGFTKEANCTLAAERYRALEKLNRVVKVDARCEFQP